MYRLLGGGGTPQNFDTGSSWFKFCNFPSPYENKLIFLTTLWPDNVSLRHGVKLMPIFRETKGSNLRSLWSHIKIIKTFKTVQRVTLPLKVCYVSYIVWKKSWIIPNKKIQKVKKKPFSHAKEKNHRGSYVTNFMELIIFVLQSKSWTMLV